MRRTPPNLKYGIALFAVAFLISAAGLYGGALLVEEKPSAAAENGVTNGGTPGGPVNVTIVARNIQFDKRTITASPGVSVTVTLDNQDAGVLHNTAFYTNRSATTRIAVGEIFAGVASRVLSFTAPSTPGNYFFRCDVHPDTMTGTFAVK